MRWFNRVKSFRLDGSVNPILLALGAALLYGASDFLGGLFSRRNHFAPVNVVGNLAASLAAVVAAISITGQETLSAATVAWALMAGVCSGLGGLALYRGLALGEMAVVGPISAVGAAVFPAAVGFALGERFSALTLAGVGLALPAIWLLAGGGPAAPRGRLADGVVDGLIAGAGFGGLFIGIERAGSGGGLWPVALAQLGALIPGLLALLVLRDSWLGRTAVGELRLTPIPGLLAVTAMLLYQASLGGGTLTVSSVITSLYPGFTVLLAMWVLQEHLAGTQRWGLAAAGTAVLLIVAG